MAKINKDKVREILKKYNLKSIPKREQYILRHCYGLDGAEVKTKAEISKELNMSSTHVIEIEKEWLEYIIGTDYKKLENDFEIKYGHVSNVKIFLSNLKLENAYEEEINIDSFSISYKYKKYMNSSKHHEESISTEYRYKNYNYKFSDKCSDILTRIEKRIMKDCSRYKSTIKRYYIKVIVNYWGFPGSVYRIYEIDTLATFYDIFKKIKELFDDKLPIPNMIKEVLN